MTVRRKVWLTFAITIVVAFLAGVVDYPKGLKLNFWKVNIDINKNVQLGLDLQGGVALLYDADTSNMEEGEKASALEGVRDVIERRVNAFGVSEPIVQTQKSGDQWRINVELPGVTDVNDAIQRIGATPTLEFREDVPQEVDPAEIEQKNAEVLTRAQDVLAQALDPNNDFAELALLFSEDPGSKENGGDLDYARRGDFVPEFEQAIFDDLAVGEVTPELIQSKFGYHIIKKVDERVVEEEGESITEVQSSHILLQTQADTSGAPNYQPTGLSGKHLDRATVTFDQNTNQPQIGLKFNSEGKDLFKDITERNVGKVVAIYLDGYPLSLPVVQQVITDGEAVISGEFTLEEAKQLARDLNAGALPVPVTLVSQQNIGATLGEESVSKSFTAGLIGLGLVALFMIVYYRLPGLLAVIALGFYALVVLAIFKIWSVTLTLAGVAGFILSIGMAVDANILIFERIKEELRDGRPIDQAVEEGFSRAWLSIRDSNVSSLITTFILAWFGTSIIKGFAITLGIGIVISMISAITVTRTIMRLVIRWTHNPWLYGVKKQKQDV